MRIQHRTFRFYKPELINENQYVQLKREFVKNPKLNLTPKTSFKKTFYKDIMFSIVIAIIVVVTQILFSLTKWDFLNFIGLLAGVLFAVQFFLRIAFEMFSYLSFYIDITSYYRNLKRRVINSENYEDMKKRYWFWVNQHLNR